MTHDVNEFPIGTIVNPEYYSFRLEITSHGDREIFAKVVKAEYLYPHAQVQPFQVGQMLRFTPGVVCNDVSTWNLDSSRWWFTLTARDGGYWFEHYR